MHTLDNIKDVLKGRLKPKRFDHSIAVLETAIKLSKIHNVSEQDTVWASLLHDYAKNLSDEQMFEYMKHFEFEIDDVFKNRINLAHGLIGAELARIDFKIHNIDILNAIRNHTFGRAGMSDLEKVIYLADYIEPSRRFKGIQLIRESAKKNLDRAMLLALEHTMGHIIGTRRLLHPNTVLARNYFIQRGGN